MAAAVTYTNFGGMLVHEDRGVTQTHYVPDTLGSTAMTINGSGTVTSSQQYWPYGELSATSTGTNPSPWGFVGLLGYLKDTVMRLYVRARYLWTDIARWMTVDRYWPIESAYNYSINAPVILVDPTGNGLACVGAAYCAGAALLAAVLRCALSGSIKEFICCIQKLKASISVFRGILIVCAALLAACVGSWILNILKNLPPLIIPRPGYGIAGLSVAGSANAATTSRRVPNACETDCEGAMENCRIARGRMPYPSYEAVCECCKVRCQRNRSWPNAVPCDYWNW